METERIILRPWRESDAETLFKYASDPDVGASGDVLQISFPSAGSALANVFLFTSIIVYLRG